MMVKLRETFLGPIKKAFIQYRFKRRFQPPLGKINYGDLKRTQPICRNYGFERGKPIDRFYIEQFLNSHSESIRGVVMEIGDNSYTIKYGGEKVSRSEVLHLTNSNNQATIIGDLADLPQVPDDSFDCIILTQTLQFIYDFKAALQTCYRVLKPGGTLLLTVPSIAPLDDNEFGSSYFWNFTRQGIKTVLNDVFPGSPLLVESKGNVFSSMAFLQGISLDEISPKDLEYNDPYIQMLIVAKASKI